jgi:hypothetical protein
MHGDRRVVEVDRSCVCVWVGGCGGVPTVLHVEGVPNGLLRASFSNSTPRHETFQDISGGMNMFMYLFYNPSKIHQEAYAEEIVEDSNPVCAKMNNEFNII